jgi:hypothetical protein
MAWLDVISPITGSSNDSGWAGLSGRQVIPSAAISNTGLGLVRVAFFSGSTEGLYITKAYIGHAAASGDAYDFESAPTQLLFGGLAYKSIAANSYEYSDTAIFSVQSGKNLVISWYIDAGQSANDVLRRETNLPNWIICYKEAEDSAATVDVSGYSTYQGSCGIFRIESAAANAAIPVLLDQYRQRKS